MLGAVTVVVMEHTRTSVLHAWRSKMLGSTEYRDVYAEQFKSENVNVMTDELGFGNVLHFVSISTDFATYPTEP